MKRQYHSRSRVYREAPRASFMGSFALFVSVLIVVLGGFVFLARLGLVHAELPDPGTLPRTSLQEIAVTVLDEVVPAPAGPDAGPAAVPDDPSAGAEPQLLEPDLELQWQDPELPNGCEATSLAMALTAAGYPADKCDLAFGTLPREEFWYDDQGGRHGPDPSQAYAGDPSSASGGWYCLEGPVIQAANDWIVSAGGGAAAETVSGLDRQALESLLQDDTPVVVWVTRDYGPARYADRFSWILPDGSDYVPYDNLHCVLLTGLEADGSYRVADPLEGWQTVDAGTFWEGFEALDCRAVVIR